MDDAPVISDAELTELALAADPDDVDIDPDAVPFGVGDLEAGLLPSWYMPAPLLSVGTHHRGRAVIITGLVAAMVIVNAVGLCVTYGIPEVGDRISSLW